jgi:hypothetical protein
MSYLRTEAAIVASNKYYEDLKQVSAWARDIRLQVPEISHGEAIRIAEKWMAEKNR